MKFIFLAGGFAGFLLTTTTGLLSGREPDLVLRDGAMGCLAGALLLRWFWSIFVKVLTEAVNAKRAAAAAAAAEAVPAQAKAK
jgi:hypothetical protein